MNHYSTGYGIHTTCPANTNSLAGSDNINDCEVNSGYYGTYDKITACPGVKDGLPNKGLNSIYSINNKTTIDDCMYYQCPTNQYRNEDAECVNFNQKDSCPSGQMFIEGIQSIPLSGSGGTQWAPWGDVDVSDYDIENMYGHDNKCLPFSDICT